ncbi:recombinase family protein [Gordonia sp. (in: high G+C Gram-positive bacteria)]|uniref:recombinase family protein n=1 Tax=Gordonia sp. (in: high G+C Gram-positive bacteria) TaxID=84139 RepID=UPI0016B7C991|nr:recombinase family protein [Gordonia sp. (in: high G+C Gram-positive bacteria)]NLG48075.1 recombinase family protein [Gordonia sp. (in: high G+C Gram-positive bacteria)]
MTIDTGTGAAYQLGYARSSGPAGGLESQIDALVDVGVEPARIYSDKADDTSPTAARSGWAALLAYARPGDTTVVVGIDRLGRTAPEVLASTLELTRRQIGLRSLREGLDSEDPVGATIINVLASLATIDEEAGGSRGESARRAHGATVGRPRALDEAQIAVAERMRAAGHPVPRIASELGVSRATVYRTLADRRANR